MTGYAIRRAAWRSDNLGNVLYTEFFKIIFCIIIIELLFQFVIQSGEKSSQSSHSTMPVHI